MTDARYVLARWRRLAALLYTIALVLALAPSAVAPAMSLALLPSQRTPETVPAGAVAALRAFAAAFARGQYAAMWARLTPDARAGWGGLPGYAAYYHAKFAPVRLIGIDLGTARMDGSAVRIPLSLHLAWRGAGAPGILALFQNVEATVVPAAHGWRVREAGPLDPTAPILPPSRPPARTLRVPILMYHHISSVPPLARSQAGLTVTDAEFQAQLAYLSAHGYRSITLVDLFNALYYGRPLPPRPVVLTFDDGYLDNYTDAFPLLRRYGMAGEFNVIAAYPGITLGVNRYMTWPQIEALSAAGMEVESHTVDHQDLGQMSAAHAVYELRFSRAIIASHIHRAVQFLAYPSGEPFRSGTLAAQQSILALLPQNGYICALLDQPAPGTRQNAQTPYQLPRVRVDPGESLAAFAANLWL